MEHLAGKRHADDDLQHAVVDRLNRLAADRYYVGISKLVSRYEKCLNVESDYVEMLVKVCATTCIFVFFPIFNTYFLIAKRSLLSGYPTYIPSAEESEIQKVPHQEYVGEIFVLPRRSAQRIRTRGKSIKCRIL
jgi:hypothetical protein